MNLKDYFDETFSIEELDFLDEGISHLNECDCEICQTCRELL